MVRSGAVVGFNRAVGRSTSYPSGISIVFIVERRTRVRLTFSAVLLKTICVLGAFC